MNLDTKNQSAKSAGPLLSEEDRRHAFVTLAMFVTLMTVFIGCAVAR